MRIFFLEKTARVWETDFLMEENNVRKYQTFKR